VVSLKNDKKVKSLFCPLCRPLLLLSVREKVDARTVLSIIVAIIGSNHYYAKILELLVF
jgi:hypothetical protein